MASCLRRRLQRLTGSSTASWGRHLDWQIGTHARARERTRRANLPCPCLQPALTLSHTPSPPRTQQLQVSRALQQRTRPHRAEADLRDPSLSCLHRTMSMTRRVFQLTFHLTFSRAIRSSWRISRSRTTCCTRETQRETRLASGVSRIVMLLPLNRSATTMLSTVHAPSETHPKKVAAVSAKRSAYQEAPSSLLVTVLEMASASAYVDLASSNSDHHHNAAAHPINSAAPHHDDEDFAANSSRRAKQRMQRAHAHATCTFLLFEEFVSVTASIARALAPGHCAQARGIAVMGFAGGRRAAARAACCAWKVWRVSDYSAAGAVGTTRPFATQVQMAQHHNSRNLLQRSWRIATCTYRGTRCSGVRRVGGHARR